LPSLGLCRNRTSTYPPASTSSCIPHPIW
jgi:hypothetical protein